jgi:hypothetical protein
VSEVGFDIAHGLDTLAALNGRGQGENVGPPSSWQPLNLLALAAEPPQPPTIVDLFYPEAVHILSGEPEDGKTWIALVASLAVARAGGLVVYFDFENGPRIILERLHALGATDEEIGSILYFRPEDTLTPELAAELFALAPALAVVDSFDALLVLQGLDSNSGTDVARCYRETIYPLKHRGATVLALDHLPKATEGRGKFAIGSQRKVAGADVHLGLKSQRPFARGHTGIATLKVHKDRHGYHARPTAAEFELASNEGGAVVAWKVRPADADQAPFRPTHLMEKVSRYVESRADTPPSKNMIEEAVHGKNDYIRVAVRLLCDEGYLHEQPPGAHGAKLLTFLRAYREDEDEAR